MEPDRPQHDGPLPVLSPISILPPPLSHLSLIAAMKNSALFKNVVFSFFDF
jgi:hypothetical protein